MKKRVVLLFILSALLVVAVTVTAAPGEPEPSATDAELAAVTTEPLTCNGLLGENLLTNPSFELPYDEPQVDDYHPDCIWGPCGTAKTAWAWWPWWQSSTESDDPFLNMPEWVPANPVYTNPIRVRTGNAAQQYFWQFSTFKAGVFQQVPVETGEEYVFSVWGHSWSQDKDDPDAYSGPVDGNLYQMVGVHPGGSTDWTPWITAELNQDNSSGSMIWSEMRKQYDTYGLFEVATTAQEDMLTVVVWARPEWPVKTNDVYWDDACLVQRKMVVPDEVAFLVDLGDPATQQIRLPITLSGEREMGWTAAISSSGSLAPTLLTSSGQAGAELELEVNTSGLPAGTHTATLTITADPAVPGSPATITITVDVNRETASVFLPTLQGR